MSFFKEDKEEKRKRLEVSKEQLVQAIKDSKTNSIRLIKGDVTLEGDEFVLHGTHLQDEEAVKMFKITRIFSRTTK